MYQQCFLNIWKENRNVICIFLCYDQITELRKHHMISFPPYSKTVLFCENWKCIQLMLCACVGVGVVCVCVYICNLLPIFSLPPTLCRLFQKRSMWCRKPFSWSFCTLLDSETTGLSSDQEPAAFKFVCYSLKTELSSQSSSLRQRRTLVCVFPLTFNVKTKDFKHFCAVLYFQQISNTSAAVNAFVRSRHVKAHFPAGTSNTVFLF